MYASARASAGRNCARSTARNAATTWGERAAPSRASVSAMSSWLSLPRLASITWRMSASAVRTRAGRSPRSGRPSPGPPPTTSTCRPTRTTRGPAPARRAGGASASSSDDDAEASSGASPSDSESDDDEEGGDDLERLRIKRLQISGGKALNTEILPALVLAKTRVDKNTLPSSKNGKIAILDGSLENKKLELEAGIEVNSLGVMKEFHERNNKYLQEIINSLENLGVELLIVRDGIADEAIPMLSKAGITAYRRFERDDIERLSRITGADIIRNLEQIEERHLGDYSSRSEENIGSINYTKIEGNLGGAMTVIFRGSTPEIRDEVSRAFDDALGVSHRLSRENRILPGGGATHTHLARKLREFSTTQSGREQMAIEAYAAALEIVPRTLAKNAGYDPIDTLLSLSAAQSKDTKKGGWIGINGNSGEVMDMYGEGIFDPIFVAKHAITGATDSAISVLRIDDVLWAKQGPETPDWSNQIDDN